jgi:predicted Zn-dependent protease
MAGGWFYSLGRMAGPKVRKGKWLWHSLTGDEADILRAELEAGRDLAATFREELGVEPDEAVRRRVAELGGQLSRCVKNRDREFTFTVTPDGEPNAFALPGGHVFVTRPLLDLIGEGEEADAELAFILGHEMAHVIKQHPMERLVSDTALGAAMRGLRVPGMAGQWLKSAGFRLLQSAYSQDRELVADKLGARLAEAARFAPEAAVRMLQRLQERAGRSDGSDLAEYFASHPPFDERIDTLNRFIAERRRRRS